MFNVRSFLPLQYVLFSLFVIVPGSASSDDEVSSIAEGGRLYDKWWQEYGLRKPGTTHPSYPATGKQQGASTWRCKECHGWDYRGREGAYGKGGHFTNIVGIRKATNRSTRELVELLKDKTHQYDQVMLDYGLEKIALFVSKGQLDMNQYIDSNKKALGNHRRGKAIFQKYCVDCHGDDGRDRNFKTKKDPEYIGTVASKNPWEALHKIRNGHPDAYVMGDPMPHMNGEISVQEQIDLLAYMQTLPKM